MNVDSKEQNLQMLLQELRHQRTRQLASCVRACVQVKRGVSITLDLSYLT